MRTPTTAITICLLAGTSVLRSQTQVGGSNSPIYYNGADVGIGTPSPGALLHVANLPPGGWGVIFEANGGNPLVAIRDSNIGSDLRFAVANGYGSWENGASPKDGIIWSSAGGLGFGIQPNVKMYINTAGNVGIGTTNPQHLLHVAGTIGAEEVLVTPTGADYVFDPGYHLAPLSEVATYIQANRHLPDIPPAEEVRRNGVGVGEMESKLLAKIEELTLHMIQADERNDRLEKQNQELRERVARLEAHSALRD